MPDQSPQPDPTLDGQRQYYDRRWSSEEYANLLGLARAGAILQCLLEANLGQPRILDLGAGTGWLASILASFGPTTAVELSAAAVAAGRQKYPGVSFVEGNLFTAPIDTGGYDVVVSQEVIEHVHDQAGYLEIAARSLVSRGFLILTTPNAWVQAHRTPEELAAWGLQPIENWLTASALRRLLAPRFRVLALRTIILGHGSTGIFRILNSAKLDQLLCRIALGVLWRATRTRVGCGLHLLAFCQRHD